MNEDECWEEWEECLYKAYQTSITVRLIHIHWRKE